jgi:hypothetical protein
VHKTYEKAPSFRFKDWKEFKKLQMLDVGREKLYEKL